GQRIDRERSGRCGIVFDPQCVVGWNGQRRMTGDETFAAAGCRITKTEVCRSYPRARIPHYGYLAPRVAPSHHQVEVAHRSVDQFAIEIDVAAERIRFVARLQDNRMPGALQ